jgi:tetratricopeptide (TPR) repeat protein
MNQSINIYLIFNPKDSLTNDYVKTKDVALVIVDQSTHKTLYVIKFSNFDEKKAWKNKAEFQQSIPSTNTQQTDGQNTQALIDLGNNMKNSGKFQEAIDAYQKVLQLTPNNDEVAVDIGNCYLAMKMRETAMESYKKAISINPNNYRAHWDLGLIFIVQGREAEARGEMKKAIEIISNMPDTDKSKQIMEEIKGKSTTPDPVGGLNSLVLRTLISTSEAVLLSFPRVPAQLYIFLSFLRLLQPYSRNTLLPTCASPSIFSSDLHGSSSCAPRSCPSVFSSLLPVNILAVRTKTYAHDLAECFLR